MLCRIRYPPKVQSVTVLPTGDFLCYVGIAAFSCACKTGIFSFRYGSVERKLVSELFKSIFEIVRAFRFDAVKILVRVEFCGFELDHRDRYV